jgi:hypothetical protein
MGKFPQARQFFNEALHLSLSDFSVGDSVFIGDAFSEENESAICYIADMLTGYLQTDGAFPPVAGVRMDTITGRLLHTAGGDVGDFALFMAGMFPENLKKHGLEAFYRTVGSNSYRGMHSASGQPLYWMLSENFGIYEIVIKNARDQYMHSNEGLRLAPDYEKPRARGVQQKDGTIKWLPPAN